MCRISVLLFLLFFCGISSKAEYVSVDVASGAARQFVNRLSSLRGEQPVFVLSHTVYLDTPVTRSGEKPVGFYVFNANEGKGFVLIAGDDRAYPVLGYSLNGSFQVEDMPEQLVGWMDSYKEEIEYLIVNNVFPTEKARQAWTDLRAETGNMFTRTIVSLNTPTWGQGTPFNNQCPTIGNDRTVSGCVATAVGSLMRYYRWPESGSGSHSYTHSTLGYISANFNVAYDWNNMLSSYTGKYSTAQADAVAQLIYHCGVALDMNYGVVESGTSLSIARIAKYFDYSARALDMPRTAYKDSEWTEMLKTQLDKQYPVLYAGQTREGNRHMYICDGYDNNNLYHINWGWNGMNNGFFSLSVLDPDKRNNGYSQKQYMTYYFAPSQYGPSSFMDLRIGKSADTDKGMTISTDEIVSGARFSVEVNSVYNTGNQDFQGSLGLLLVTKDNQIRQVLSRLNASNPCPPGYYYPSLKFDNVSIPGTINPTDKLCTAYSLNERDWTLIKGGEEMKTYISVGDPTSSNMEIPEADRIKAYAREGFIMIQQAPLNSKLFVYSVSGKMVGQYTFTGEPIQVGPATRGVYYIKGEKEVVSVVN